MLPLPRLPVQQPKPQSAYCARMLIGLLDFIYYGDCQIFIKMLGKRSIKGKSDWDGGHFLPNTLQIKMEKFCGGPLWDTELSWNSSNPNLSPCVRDFICPLVACSLLWLSLPLWYFWVSTYQPKLKVKTSLEKSIFQRLTLVFLS